MIAKIQKGRKSDWRIAFKEGVQIDKNVLQETFSTQPAEDDFFAARYDLSFLTPRGRSIRCKVGYVTSGNIRSTGILLYNHCYKSLEHTPPTSNPSPPPPPLGTECNLDIATYPKFLFDATLVPGVFLDLLILRL